MNYCLLLILGFVLVAGTLCALLPCKLRKKELHQQQKIEEIQKRRDKTRCESVDAGLMEWLKMLELPQLEEEKRLKETARQLRIVLVERLMRGPKVD